jgi:hypothetical protein
MKKISLLLALFFFLWNNASAQAGSDGLAFLKLGAGGRSLGMGEAYSAAANDPTATYYNPAALSLSQSSQIVLMHKSWVQDIKTEYFAAQTPYGDLNLGLSVNSTSVDNIEIRTTPGPAQGTFSSRNASVGISMAYSISPSLAIGVTANYLYEKILIDDASGLGFNFGALYMAPEDIRIGFAVNNLGSMSSLGTEATKLPTSVRVGAARTMPFELMDAKTEVTLTADVVDYTVEGKTHVHVGGEIDYEHTFAVRLGYMTGYESRSFTAGMGIQYNLVNLDYAYVPFQYDLGTTHTFSLGFRF